MGSLFKWSFRVVLVAFLLRTFAPETPLYKTIAPITEPFFEAIFEGFSALLSDGKQLQDAQKEVEIVTDEENESTMEEKEFNQVQEFDALMPCQSKIEYVTHLHKWEDNGEGRINKKFGAKFTILPSLACQAESFREKLPEPISDGSTKDYYGKVYIQLAKDNRSKMDRIYKTYETVKSKYKLNYRQFADMVVSSVQEIPYVLVHPESCYKARQWGGFMETYHQEGKECLPNIRFGLTSPSEFIYNLKGDCDTRTVFLYTVLSHFGYDVAIFVSRTHCVLGINLSALHGDYLTHKGKKYFFWETTAKGFTPGILPNEFKNDTWYIALVKPSSNS
ncbi:MAG: hypothetical protein OHK0045_19440 [Raineya sp.]